MAMDRHRPRCSLPNRHFVEIFLEREERGRDVMRSDIHAQTTREIRHLTYRKRRPLSQPETDR